MYRTFYRHVLTEPKRDFLSLFPVPDFLAMTSLGFDISDDSIKALELIRRGGTCEVGFFASADIPKGIIKTGEILNPSRLQQVIAAMQREHRFVFVNASLPEQKAYLFTTTVKGSGGVSVRQNIEFHLEENVPLSQEEAVFDYEVYRTYKKQGKKYKDVSVSAVSKSHSESYASLLKRSGLRPVSLMVEAEAVAKAVIPDGDPRTYMVIDMGKTRTGVSVVSEGVTRYTSTIEIGGSHLTEHLASTLNTPFEVAEENKREHGLVGTGEAQAVSVAIEEKLNSLMQRIGDQLQYWHSQVDERGVRTKRVTTIVLCGGSALLKGLKPHFQKKLAIETELANVWSNVRFRKHYVPTITFEESLSYAAAIGLAIEQQ